MKKISHNQKSQEQFLIDLEIKQPELFNSIKILGKYVNNKTPILIESKYGKCLVHPCSLLKGYRPTISIAINKTEYFKKELKSRQPKIFENIEILSKYERALSSILIKTKYGNCLVRTEGLLRGTTPTIMSAVNKTEYFKNELKDKQPNLYNSIEIIGEYKSCKKCILIASKYGDCLITPSNLLNNCYPNITNAIDKNEYFKNQAIEVRGNLYDYSLVDYINCFKKIKIISSEGIFEQTPANHLQGTGCPLLQRINISKFQQENPTGFRDSVYIKRALNSKHCDSFRVYVIKCYNDIERFYKIGKTSIKIKKRFGYKKDMPYNYEVIDCIEFEKTEKGGVECCELERALHKYFKQYKYTPIKKFAGMYECFSELPIID